MHIKLHRLAFSSEKATRIVEIPHEKERLDEPGSRNPFVRDKDRILYSKPFRRLAYKTQVFVTSAMNDSFDEHCRTRLSHTLEVANIAKRVSLKLRLNSDLTEAIALGHDVGHTPYGHAGEKLLNEFLEGSIPYPMEALRRAQIDDFDRINMVIPHENFNHSFQSVRALTSYNDYSMHDRGLGMRITFQTLTGILKHTDKFKKECIYPEVYKHDGQTITFSNLIKTASYQSIESNIVAISDEIAQVVHDISDAIKMNLINIEMLNNPIFKTVICNALNYHRRTTGSSTTFDHLKDLKPDILSHQLTTCFIEYFSGSTVTEIDSIINKKGILKLQAIEKIGNKPYPVADYETLIMFKDSVILNSQGVVVMDNKGKAIINGILDSYLIEPRQLPNSVIDKLSEILLTPSFRITKDSLKRIASISGPRSISQEIVISKAKMLNTEGQNNIRYISVDDYKVVYPFLISSRAYRRVLVDYIAQMTDNYAEEEFRRLQI